MIRGATRAALASILCAAVAASPAAAQPRSGGGAPAPATAAGKSIAVLGFDALGMEPGKVARLESLFRMELERLAGKPTPSPREIARALRGTSLARCGGESSCVAAIGRKLGVDLVVTGNVGTLGDSHVINIKVVDARGGQELRRIASDPLRGDPDELIDAVRVAAYRLLAPERIRGSIVVLADIAGAEVALDGQRVGVTPLARPIGGLEPGAHRLEVSAGGYSPFAEEVQVRFQKTTRVLVRLVEDPSARPLDLRGAAGPAAEPPPRWYQSTWFLVGAGVAAAVVGGAVGYALARDEVIDCSASPEGCR
ncbi:MAG TPA: PEGA domain-containing protein [Kofleriaceae bacterium]|nr:PEGA domain-containing protein [Kofleriaceae bacterium]